MTSPNIKDPFSSHQGPHFAFHWQLKCWLFLPFSFIHLYPMSYQVLLILQSSHFYCSGGQTQKSFYSLQSSERSCSCLLLFYIHLHVLQLSSLFSTFWLNKSSSILLIHTTSFCFEIFKHAILSVYITYFFPTSNSLPSFLANFYSSFRSPPKCHFLKGTWGLYPIQSQDLESRTFQGALLYDCIA